VGSVVGSEVVEGRREGVEVGFTVEGMPEGI